MNGPMIQRDEDWRDDSIVYTLRVPGLWLITTRWPRLQLAWWLVRMVFQGEPKAPPSQCRSEEK